jgi:signal transduction histidine kinase
LTISREFGHTIMDVIRGLAETRSNRRRFALFVVVVCLPVIALGYLAIRTFQSEQLKEQFQQQERQQQILRLLEADLGNWIQSSPRFTPGKHHFEVSSGLIRFSSLNVFIATMPESVQAKPLSGAEQNSWWQALTAEVRGADPAEVSAGYRTLMKQFPDLASWARLALLRLSLRAGDMAEAFFWLEEIKARDLEAVTQSQIPIWAGASQLLAEHDLVRGRPEALDFQRSMLDELKGGRWNLNAARWILYARTAAEMLQSENGGSPLDLVQSSLKDAEFLEACTNAYPEILALHQALQGGNHRPFAAAYLRQFPGVLVLVPGKENEAGCILEPDRLVGEAATRLNALTAAENYAGVVVLPPDGRPATSPLAAFPFLEIYITERSQTRLVAHLRRYSILYATATLFLVTGVGLVFTVRAIAREVEVSRMKADFVSSVSHEFRTPLSSIDAVLERIESGKVRDSEMLERYCRLSRQEVQRLTRMVSDLLDFERLEKGRAEFSFETLDLNCAAAEVIESFRNLGFGERLVEALDREDVLLTIRADRNAVLQCIHNLVDNALKYSPDPTPVTIGTGRRGRNPCVEVTDQGPGIAEKERDMVFEPFYRSRNPDAQGVKGTGIGLALVKRIMEAHGGNVGLESHPAEGSTFALIFPGNGE